MEVKIVEVRTSGKKSSGVEYKVNVSFPNTDNCAMTTKKLSKTQASKLYMDICNEIIKFMKPHTDI